MRLAVKNIYDQLYDTVCSITTIPVALEDYLSMLTYKVENASVVYVGITKDYGTLESEYQSEILNSTHPPRYPGYMLYHTSLGVRMFTTDTAQLIT